MNKIIIRVIETSSAFDEELLLKNLKVFESLGATVRFDPVPLEYSNSITRESSVRKKALQFKQAFLEPESNVILSARGGYGASDLLFYLSDEELKGFKKKPLVGFSDVSALHSGLYSMFGLSGIHGTMPSFYKCGENGNYKDIEVLLDILAGNLPEHKISLTPLIPNDPVTGTKSGPVFGGCLTVLTAMIGTKYFPVSLKNHILFWEDITESLPRLLRCLNQWIYSGALDGVQGIVFGKFVSCGENVESQFAQIVNERTKIPCYLSGQFGHISPNFPLIIGKKGNLTSQYLSWELKQNELFC